MPTEVRARLLAAVAMAKGGDWEAAHEIAQSHEGDALADWLHAVVHRMEGDLGNARYWYGRCARAANEAVPIADELTQIEQAAREG